MASRVLARLLLPLALASALASTLSGCLGSSSSHTLSQADQGFLSQVENAQPSITNIRSATQLVRLGHAVCSDFAAGASYQETADRLSLDTGAGSLPSQDLGTVIQAASQFYCPQYQSKS